MRKSIINEKVHPQDDNELNGRWYTYHIHSLSVTRLYGYIRDNPGKTGPGLPAYNCGYSGGIYGSIWSHDDLMALAKVHLKDKFGTIEVEKLVEVPVEVPVEVIKIVEVPLALALSFGEAASLQASLYHGQHLLNEDVRLAYVENDTTALELARARLDDHLTLMEKLGVPPARWDDNERALKRATGAAAHQMNGTIWS